MITKVNRIHAQHLMSATKDGKKNTFYSNFSAFVYLHINKHKQNEKIRCVKYVAHFWAILHIKL